MLKNTNWDLKYFIFKYLILLKITFYANSSSPLISSDFIVMLSISHSHINNFGDIVLHAKIFILILIFVCY